ncbi:hypothetical protein [Xylanimonas protaetiae]|uniref:Uncharacterized protein n=1 Tax=Xylanimonas protaetiae TaxID=2509457 RepID=A0A4P6F4A6_9MICO|nr:hypothetical protein [Xylanimonas protaetiae]QAY70394.1 hypothetical protein ET471_10415 [Xylanimonas protaetiae]
MAHAADVGSAVTRHVTVRTSMRPPRAVILFRGDEHWRRWATLALAAAQETWAGGGHLIVPYSDVGAIAPVLMPVLAAYDPDHVLLFEPTARQWETVEPGRFRINDSDGQALEGDERVRLLASDAGEFRPHDEAGAIARDYLVRHLTPFIEHWADDGTLLSLAQSIATGEAAELTRAPGVDLAAAHIAVPQSWTSDAALVAGSVLGFRDKDGAEPEAIDDHEILRYAYGTRSKGSPPAALWVGSASDTVRTRNELLDATVSDLTSGFSREAGVVVVGDTAEDFTLAMAYRLLLGAGIWVTSEMLADERVLNLAVGSVVRDLGWRARNRASHVRCVSASLDEGALTDALLSIESSAIYSIGGIEPKDRLAPTPPPDLRSGLRRKLMVEGVGDQRAVAVEVKDDGTMAMVNAFVPPVPQQSRLADDGYWYVDVAIDGSTMPTGRALRGDALSQPATWPEAVRSGADGLSMATSSRGFIPAGAVLTSRLAHPRLVSLGVQSWVAHMARADGFDVSHSQAGQAARLAERRLGSRPALTDLIASPFHHVLLGFQQVEPHRAGAPRGAASGDATPSRLLLDKRPYLSFSQMLALVPDESDVSDKPAWLRAQFDLLQDHGLARMGVVLRCEDCGRQSFIGVDDMFQRYRCPLCGASNSLTSARWWKSEAEPSWMYDLHSSLRQIATQRGDLPMRAAARLSASARGTYGDSSEVEFIQNGHSYAEIDLIAHADGDVVIVEAKAGAKLGDTDRRRGRQAAKLARVARTLRADRVVLATDQSSWPEADLVRVRTAVDAEYRGLRVPLVEAMVDL